MRELDLRLARTTERARELKTMARHAAEQAERAAASVTAENKVRKHQHRDRFGTILGRAFDIEILKYTRPCSSGLKCLAVTQSVDGHVYVRLNCRWMVLLFSTHASPAYFICLFYQGTSSRHHEGRGPVAVEDVTNNHPRLRLPLPLSSEPAPFGAISSRVSNGSARQMDSDGGGGTGSRTERSEMSAASGSQPRADGPGSSSRDGQARGGRVFVTQT